jgi:hypothetical protein
VTPDLAELRESLNQALGVTERPRPLHIVEPLVRLQAGEISITEAATAARTTRRRLESLLSARDPVAELLGPIPEFTPEIDARLSATLGQLLIGLMAERVFVDLWNAALGDGDLTLRDDRRARGDTDFLVDDSRGRQVFRLNIKFHGSSFRRAHDLVGLAPEDTFALATYKIHSALEKQDAEHLPYIFVIVGVRGLTGSVVGEVIPNSLVRLVAVAHGSRRVVGKRSLEDAVVTRLVDEPSEFGIQGKLLEFLQEIRNAEWRVLSARRADGLLRRLLFERAYALRVRGFTRNYPGAELDMHFSVSEDLHPLDELFDVLREHGMTGLVSRLERGTL